MKYRVRYKVWFEKNGKFLLGEGSAKLLFFIEKYGSLSKASKHLCISYKKAWKIINDIEKLTGETLIESKRGGRGGGGTFLTIYGKDLLKEFEKVDKAFRKTKEKVEEEIL